MHNAFTKRRHKLPPVEIYVSTVDALYGDARSLFVGAASAVAAAGLTAWKANEWALLVCAVALALIGVLRSVDMSIYARQDPKPSTVEAARYWEKRYIVGSSAYVGVLGVWCFLAFTLTNDAAVQLISFSVTLAYLVGITGRNFSSDQLVTTQSIASGVPMIAGLLARGGWEYIFLAALLVPFFLSIRTISGRLRSILLEAVIASHDVQLLASRFDTALNNMPHGLCMFDSEQRLVVSNGRFIELLGLGANIERRGTAVGELLSESADGGTIDSVELETLQSVFVTRLRASRRSLLPVDTPEGRALEITFQPMDNGGCVVLVEDVTERRDAEEKIEYLAHYDALTGLPNRTYFQRQFDDVLATSRPGVTRAVLFIDLDQFKKVNDTLGHPFGDALLCSVAERLCKVVRKSDLVGRFGGDEFVVLQTLRRGTEDAAAMASRIVQELGEIYEIGGHQIVIGASIGIAVAPQDGANFDELLKSADMALYRSKADGRGVWRFFEKDMDVKAQARRALELDIREALGRGEFELYYQPIVNLKTGTVSTCEALLRWPHPERGMVPPSEFIPIAEEMGLIVELGNWVLRQACLECAKWPRNVRVAVNLSPIQFRRSNVEMVISDALECSGLPGDRLEIEITESVLLQDTPTTHRTLNKLRRRGVRLSLDDFGTGYSSLSYLHRFPLNKIKVDRSFLSGVSAASRSMTLLRGVARLSSELGMSVVVEGVETPEQAALLAEEDSIDEVQGYLFSRPVPSDEIMKYLTADHTEILQVA